MAMIGEMPTFNSKNDDWQVYTERLEQFFVMNDIPEEKKKAILITSIDSDIYKILRDVCYPVQPAEKSFDEICTLLNKQFVVQKSMYRERHRFYNSHRGVGESIASWFARLKKLSVDCHFGEEFDAVLLDRFISGLQPSVILDRLCEETSLTLQQAVDIAVSKESSSAQSVSVENEVGAQGNHGYQRDDLLNDCPFGQNYFDKWHAKSQHGHGHGHHRRRHPFHRFDDSYVRHIHKRKKH